MGGHVEHRRPDLEAVDRPREPRRQLGPDGQHLGEGAAGEARHLGGGLLLSRRPGEAALEHVLPHRGQVAHDVADVPAGAGGHLRVQAGLVETADQGEQAGPGVVVELREGGFRHGCTIGPAGRSRPPAPVDAKLRGWQRSGNCATTIGRAGGLSGAGISPSTGPSSTTSPPAAPSSACAPARTACSAFWPWTTPGRPSGWPTAWCTPRPGPGSQSATWKTSSSTRRPGVRRRAHPAAGGQGGRDRAGGRHGLLAHPAVQRPSPLPLRPGGAADVLRRLRDVVDRRRSQPFRRVSPMPHALLRIPAPSRARR